MSDQRIDTALEVTPIRKLILIGIAVLMVAAPAAGGATKVAAAAPPRLVVAMQDPGCHWFYLGGGLNHRKFAKTLTRGGPVRLVNLDEAALKIKGPGGTKTERVGASLTLSAPGIYTITMVGQAPDDNHLKLTLK